MDGLTAKTLSSPRLFYDETASHFLALLASWRLNLKARCLATSGRQIPVLKTENLKLKT
jgi:hypothetical protein